MVHNKLMKEREKVRRETERDSEIRREKDGSEKMTKFYSWNSSSNSHIKGK
jgi:hypothetical protein